MTRDPAAATRRQYLVLNVGGSAALAVNGVAHAAWPSAVLNVLWLSLALDAVRRRRAARQPTDPAPSNERIAGSNSGLSASAVG